MAEQRERSRSFLEQYDFRVLESHYFEVLESSFWDSENIMTKKYKAIKEKIIKNEKEGDIESLEKAYKILITTKTRKQYCKFLMYQYTLSQPLNMELLTEKYYSIIFPFYLFLLKSEKEDNKYIVLDNMNFSINYYEKNVLKNSFEVDTIEDMRLNLNDNTLKIKIIKTKTDIIYSPLIENTLQLLYALIIFMGLIKKRKDNWKKDQTKVNEINQNLKKETITTIFDANEHLNKKINEFKLLTLSNDSFVPKGIKYYAYIQDKSKNNNSLTNKFLVLGSSYIFLFKDQEMTDILNIIPLIPGLTMFEFSEKDKIMKINIGLKEYNFYIDNLEAFSKIHKIVINISEGEDELFDDDDLVKVSESLYNDKIMGGELKDTPFFFKSEKDLSKLEITLKDLKKAKAKAEEKEVIYKIIKNVKDNNNDKKDIKENNNKNNENKINNNNNINEIKNNINEENKGQDANNINEENKGEDANTINEEKKEQDTNNKNDI